MSEKFHQPFVIIRLADMAVRHGYSGAIKTEVNNFTKYFKIFLYFSGKYNFAFDFMPLCENILSHIFVTKS
ncbi:hypothetical protein DS739_00535 [Acetobacter sp. JWB]|nr:hypothetical protein CPF11_06890 [Acetobacter pomorum]AXC25433.1 hypothetical protein DS739_00535 [Acetobacter sp. JWB]